MAGLGRRVFAAGEILTAANLQGFAVDQSVMVFDDATARAEAIPTPSEGMVTYLKDTDVLEVFDGSDFVPVAIEPDPPNGFTASTTITATDSSFPVPALGSPIVKVTVIGGGGGGAAVFVTNTASDGGATTFNAGGAGSVSAAGGLGGRGSVTVVGFAGKPGFVSNNGGESSQQNRTGDIEGMQSGNGTGGAITVAYLDLTGISTINVTIGSGGPGVASGTRPNGGAGGRGEVILEFVAA